MTHSRQSRDQSQRQDPHRAVLRKLQGLARQLLVDKIPYHERMALIRAAAHAEGLLLRDNEILAVVARARKKLQGRSGPVLPGEEVEMTEESWAWDQVLVAGSMNLLVALPKVGKSALLAGLIAAWHRGDPDFLGHRLHGPCPPVLIAGPDQTSKDWRGVLAPVGLMELNPKTEKWRLPADGPIKEWWHQGRPIHLDEQGLEDLTDACERHPGALLVLDSYESLTAPLGISESLGEAVEPLHGLAESVAPFGITTVLIHHAAKGRAGERASLAARGHGSIPAAASQIIGLHWLNPDSMADQRIVLTTEGRTGVPVELIVRQADRSQWESCGDAAVVRQQQRRAKAEANLNDRQEAALELVRSRWEQHAATTAADLLAAPDGAELFGSDRQARRTLDELGKKDLLVGSVQTNAAGTSRCKSWQPAGTTPAASRTRAREVSPEECPIRPLCPIPVTARDLENPKAKNYGPNHPDPSVPTPPVHRDKNPVTARDRTQRTGEITFSHAREGTLVEDFAETGAASDPGNASTPTSNPPVTTSSDPSAAGSAAASRPAGRSDAGSAEPQILPGTPSGASEEPRPPLTTSAGLTAAADAVSSDRKDDRQDAAADRQDDPLTDRQDDRLDPDHPWDRRQQHADDPSDQEDQAPYSSWIKHSRSVRTSVRSVPVIHGWEELLAATADQQPLLERLERRIEQIVAEPPAGGASSGAGGSGDQDHGSAAGGASPQSSPSAGGSGDDGGSSGSEPAAGGASPQPSPSAGGGDSSGNSSGSQDPEPPADGASPQPSPSAGGGDSSGNSSGNQNPGSAAGDAPESSSQKINGGTASGGDQPNAGTASAECSTPPPVHPCDSHADDQPSGFKPWQQQLLELKRRRPQTPVSMLLEQLSVEPPTLDEAAAFLDTPQARAWTRQAACSPPSPHPLADGLEPWQAEALRQRQRHPGDHPFSLLLKLDPRVSAGVDGRHLAQFLADYDQLTEQRRREAQDL